MGDLRMIDRDGASPTMLADLEHYWQGLRGGHVPDRVAIDPACIDQALPHAFVLERLAPGVGRVRVAGKRLGDYLGQDLRGLPICTLFAPESRERFQGWLEQVFALPALVELPLSSRWGLGRPRLTGRMLLLPLRDGTGKVTRAIGAIRTEGGLGRLPRAFELAEDGAVRIQNLADMPVVKASATQVAPPVPHPASRPYLRLVVSNH